MVTVPKHAQVSYHIRLLRRSSDVTNLSEKEKKTSVMCQEQVAAATFFFLFQLTLSPLTHFCHLLRCGWQTDASYMSGPIFLARMIKFTSSNDDT